MEFVEEKVKEILIKNPSECSYLDYKIVPYTPSKKHDFVKDVIAMLNSEEAIGKDKFIVFGVEDKTRYQKGIDIELCPDDNIFQNWANSIVPRPQIQSGILEFNEKLFGYIYISKENIDRVYEVAKTVIGDADIKNLEKAGVYKGQAYFRQGSCNGIMMQEQRLRILQQKVQKQSMLNDMYYKSSTGMDYEHSKAFVVAIMLGQWDENCFGDTKIVEEMYGDTYIKFIAIIRDLHCIGNQQISINNRIWKISNRKNALEAMAKNIYDDNVDLLCTCSKKIYGIASPKYDLPSEQRYAYEIYKDQQKEVYSSSIIQGISEFFALAGNNTEIFTSCSKHKIELSINSIIENIFGFENWKNYASLQDIFDFFAEACPRTFLEEMEKALISNNEAFIEYINRNETGITTTYYGQQFKWILPKLAAFPEFFTKACHVLFLLASFREDYLNSLVGIVLPWFPQTLAKPNVRCGMIKGLVNSNEELGWKILMKLMPKRTTTGNPIQSPKYMNSLEIPENVAMIDYWKEEENYIRLACLCAIGKQDKLIQLIEVIDDVSKDIFNEIILVYEKSVNLVEDKTEIWDALLDIINKHRKYSDTKWALPEEALSKLEELAEKYRPSNLDVQSRRIFKNDQYDLLEEKGNWEENEKKLFDIQKDIIKDIYDRDKLKGILVFNQTIERQDILGRGLAYSEIQDSEAIEILKLAMSDDLKLKDFTRGYINAMSFVAHRQLLSYINCLETDLEKVKVYTEMQFSEMNIQTILKLSKEAQEYYWKNILIHGMEELPGDKFDLVIKKLNENKRIKDAICLLFYKGVYGKQLVCAECLVEALDLYVENQEVVIDSYKLRELIRWLEDNYADEQKIIDIEWKYLNIFDDENRPKFLQKEISNNPDFYMDMICYAFKGHKEEKRILSEAERIIAGHCHKLLFSWKRTPGLKEDGSIDSDELYKWYNKARKISIEKDRYEIAMTYFGHTLFYAPSDKDGFFIDRKVADIIQSDKEGHIGRGYSTEAYNSRGVHWCDPTGEAEFQLEKEYLEKAEEADSKGYFKLGEIMRNISKTYHNEGLYNIEEHRQRENTE